MAWALAYLGVRRTSALMPVSVVACASFFAGSTNLINIKSYGRQGYFLPRI